MVSTDEVDVGSGGETSNTDTGSTDAPPQPDSPPDSDPEPDEPEPHPICGQHERHTYTFTVEEYTERLSAVVDGWSCDDNGGTGFDDGVPEDPTDDTGSTGTTGTTPTWDDVPIVCGIMCRALTCEDELEPNECLSVNWTECGWTDPNEAGQRTMTCCYTTTDGCP